MIKRENRLKIVFRAQEYALRTSILNPRIPYITTKEVKMAEEQQAYDASADYLGDINVRLRDIEEKQNIIKDRVLLIGENLISEKEEIDSQVHELRQELNKVNSEIKKIKLAIERIGEDLNNFVRKNEFEILQRQFEMFQPLNLARISDVEAMIEKAFKNKNK